MKYVLVIGDGMADTKLAALAHHTPMEVLALNAFDRVAGCSLGRVLTVPHGVAVNSANAVMSILGYDPKACEADASLTPFAEMFGCEGSFICAPDITVQIRRLEKTDSGAWMPAAGESGEKAEKVLKIHKKDLNNCLDYQS